MKLAPAGVGAEPKKLAILWRLLLAAGGGVLLDEPARRTRRRKSGPVRRLVRRRQSPGQDIRAADHNIFLRSQDRISEAAALPLPATISGPR